VNIFFIIATFLYFLGMVKYLLHLATKNRILFILATIMITLGFVAETVAFGQRSMVTGHGPYTNVFEYCAFLSWAVFGVFLIAEGYFKIKPLGAFMVPVGFALMLIAMALFDGAEATLPVKAYWLTMHRTLSFLSFGAFTLVFAAGVMYLIQERELKSKHFGGWYHRLPPLGVLDDMNRMGLIFGFPIISVGVVAAIVWSSQSYGFIIRVNTSTVLLMVGWVMYATLLVGRAILGWRGRRAAAIGVAGFCVVIAALLIHIG